MTITQTLFTLTGTLALGFAGAKAAAASPASILQQTIGAAPLALRSDSIDPDGAGDRDDRPYRNKMRKAEPRGGARGSSCAEYIDDDGDGVCDNCGRSPKGCPADGGSANPYAGKPSAQDYERQSTLVNMQTAYNGESNAHAKYLAFAQKADQEGYAGVASLFRAAAKAESVHAENHAEVIRQLGGSATATIDEIEIGSTRENLESAISGESYEWDEMYPGMISRARRDRDRSALRSLNFAMTAEREHAKLFRAALKDIESYREARTFYVCAVCGETVVTLDFKKCPSCFAKVDEYVKVD